MTRHRYTCVRCGRADHETDACPAPVERDVVGYLCLHGGTPEVVRVGFQCVDDEAVHDGDTVATVTRYETIGTVSEGMRMNATYTATVDRGCRATSEDGRRCNLGAGHASQFNHKDPRTGKYWRVEPVE